MFLAVTQKGCELSFDVPAGHREVQPLHKHYYIKIIPAGAFDFSQKVIEKYYISFLIFTPRVFGPQAVVQKVIGRDMMSRAIIQKVIGRDMMSRAIVQEVVRVDIGLSKNYQNTVFWTIECC